MTPRLVVRLQPEFVSHPLLWFSDPLLQPFWGWHPIKAILFGLKKNPVCLFILPGHLTNAVLSRSGVPGSGGEERCILILLLLG